MVKTASNQYPDGCAASVRITVPQEEALGIPEWLEREANQD